MKEFNVGDIVEKYTGDYNAIGEVCSVYYTPAGNTRYMVALTKITKGAIMHTLSVENIRSTYLEKSQLETVIEERNQAVIERGIANHKCILLEIELNNLKARIKCLI